jgi:S1-C subfamily serine protease
MKRAWLLALLAAGPVAAGELAVAENAVVQAARTARDAVVTVLPVKKPFAVTGVVVARGVVLTIRRPFVEGTAVQEGIQVRYPGNGKTVAAEIIEEDPDTNTILLKAPGGKARAIKPRRDENVHLGAWALMVGNTFHSGKEGDPVVSLGVVSGLERTPEGLKNFHTSTLVNPGSVGAPVVDLDGGLLGIMDMRITGAGGQTVVIPYERIFRAYQDKRGRGARALGSRPYKRARGSSVHDLLGVCVEDAARRAAAVLVAVRAGDPEGGAPAAAATGETKEPEKKEQPAPDPKRKRRAPPVPRPVPGQRPAHDRSSGVVVSPDGLIVCPLRVTGWPGPPRSLLVDFADGSTRKAKRLGYDERLRIAVLRVETRDLPVLPAAPADEPRPGRFAVALGYPHENPDGGSPQVTFGIISRTGALGSLHPALRALQTDAGVAGGNRGGPLVDLEGRLLGVLLDVNDTEPMGYRSRTLRGRYVGNAGLGFAVPVDVLSEVVPRLEKGEVLQPVYLGVGLAAVPEGLRIANVVKDGPSAKAGLVVGDVIVAVAGKEVKTVPALQQALLPFNSGAEIDVTVLRDGKKQTVKVKLDAPPAK